MAEQSIAVTRIVPSAGRTGSPPSFSSAVASTNTASVSAAKTLRDIIIGRLAVLLPYEEKDNEG